ncbi:MAG: hypothetical protein K2Y23_20175 [Cyanobacteria bacterium]|nr:hypothetical protein [Cyanobacteriota bacterium]
MIALRGAMALAGMLIIPLTAGAQEAPALRAHHFTLGGGVVWSGAYDIGDAAATLLGNGAGASAPPFTLFDAKSRITPATSPELRIGFAVTRATALEFSLAYTRPRVGVSISADPEAPAQELPGEQLKQFLIGGAATWQVPIRMGNRLAPFVTGGAAFLRQLHEDQTLGESGQVYYAGAGARYFLRGGHGAGRAFGLRGDARVNFRRNGIDFEDKMRTYPTVSLAAFIGF